MQTTTQPQTTNNSNDRDASVQIPETEEKAKFFCLIDGAKAAVKQQLAASGVEPEPGITSAALGYLARTLELLTSSEKHERERAKKRVRELVKLGRQAAE